MSCCNSYGGYIPNNRASIYYSRELDRMDNPEIANLLSNTFESVTQSDFTPKSYDGKQFFEYVAVPSHSGFNRTKPLHSVPWTDVQEAQRHRTVISYNPYYKVQRNCNAPIPETETHEAYMKPLPNLQCKLAYNPVLDSPGTHLSGYTNWASPNPITFRHMDPIWCGQLPELGQGFRSSVSRQDFGPKLWNTGWEMKANVITSFERESGFYNRQKPTPILPRICPDRCDPVTVTGCKECYNEDIVIVAKWIGIFARPPDLNMFKGDGSYLTETKERFLSPQKFGRATHGHLRGAVGFGSGATNSGFYQNRREHNLGMPRWFDPCLDKVTLPCINEKKEDLLLNRVCHPETYCSKKNST